MAAYDRYISLFHMEMRSILSVMINLFFVCIQRRGFRLIDIRISPVKICQLGLRIYAIIASDYQDISVLLGPESGQDENKTTYASPEQEIDPRSAPTWGSLTKHIRLTSLIKG